MFDLRKNKSEEPDFDSAGFTEEDRLIDDYYENEYNQNQPADNEPPYIAVSSNGKRCWEIQSIVEDVTYKVWAFSYKEALEIIPRIESL